MDCALMIEGQEGVSWEDWLALASTCESAGVAGLYRSDHYLSFSDPDGPSGLDAWTSLAALAAVTTSLRLGTLVSPVGFRPPGLLAKTVTSVDAISGGRVELGLGAGWFEDEHRAFGFPFPSLGERYRALEETLAVLDSLGHPFLILGGDAGPKGAALAARWADEYNLLEVTPELAGVRRRALADACRARGRDPDTLSLSLMINTVIGRDRGELRDRVGRLAARTGGARGDDVLTGTPDEVLERLREYADQGVRRVMLQQLDHTDLDMVRLIGERIAPELRRLAAP